MSKKILIINILIFLIYGLSLSFLSHQGFPDSMNSGLFMPYLSDKPVGEDGFYMLTAAWNLASKYKLAYNYDQIVTGIQPLSTFVYSMIAWIVQAFGGDKWTFIRWIIVFNILNILICANILGIIAITLACDYNNTKNRISLYVTTFTLTIFNFLLFTLFTYGLETGLYLTFIALCLLMTLKFPQMGSLNLKQGLSFGVLCGFTGLCRIDFGIILFVLLSLLLLQRRLKFFWSLMVGIVALLIVSPWFIWTYYVSDWWMPSSGFAEMSIINKANAYGRLRFVIGSLIRLFFSWLSPWIFEHYISLNRISIVYFLLLMGILVLLFKKYFYHLKITSSIKYQFIVSWLFAFMSLIIIYPLFFHSTYFYVRYFSPLLILLLPFLAIVINEKITQRLIIRRFFLCFLYIFFLLGVYLTFHNGKVYHSQSIVAGFIEKRFNQSTKIGVMQSGIIGFFNSNIVNLDGKMNFTAIKYYSQNKLPLYLDKEKIDVIIEWKYLIYWAFLHYYKEYFTKYWEFIPVDIPDGKTGVLIRKSIGGPQGN